MIRKPIAIAALILLWACLLAILFASVGCACLRSPPDIGDGQPPSVADQLRAWGAWFITVGAIAAGAGWVLRLVWAVAPIFAWVSRIPIIGRIPGDILTAIGTAGVSGMAWGIAVTWIADYLWAVALAAVVALAGWAWLHRSSLRRLVAGRATMRAQTFDHA